MHTLQITLSRHTILLSILLESVWQRPVVLLTLDLVVDPVMARHDAMVGGDAPVAWSE